MEGTFLYTVSLVTGFALIVTFFISLAVYCRRWADMDPEVKQRYQQMAEEGRQKYDEEMAAYRQRQVNICMYHRCTSKTLSRRPCKAF